MSNGFIPVRRSLFDHFLFTEHRVFSRFEAWMDLIQMASFTDENKVMINGKLIKRNRGEVVASLRFLMKRWNWSMSRVCDYIELLRIQQMVVATKENGVTKILLVNFDKHNSVEEKNSKKDRKGYSKTLDSIGFDRNEETAIDTAKETAGRQPGDSEDTNIIKVNKENNSNNEDDGARAPVYTEEEENLFSAFKTWITKYAPKVNKMKEPLTIKQYLKLRKDFPGEEGRALLQEIILAMHNFKELLKKYESANLTLRSWINLRIKNGTVKVQSQPHGTQSSINEKLKAAGKKTE
jgi:hypothetical protein